MSKGLLRAVGLTCLSGFLALATEAQGAATATLRAVAKNGTPITPTNNLAIAPNDTITVELYFFGWNSPPYDGSSGLVKTFQATLAGRAGVISNGAGPTELSKMVLPTTWNAPLDRVSCPCTAPFECSAIFGPQYGCTLPGFNPNTMASITTSRFDFILNEYPNISSESEASLDIRWSGTIDGNDGVTASRCVGGPIPGASCLASGDCAGGTCNQNFLSYAGTLNLKAGAEVCGTTTFTLVADVSSTFLSPPGFIPAPVLPSIQSLTLVAPKPCTECIENADCDDGNPCTEDLCIEANCQFANISGSCDAGDPCTTDDYCLNGTCITGIPVDCSGVGGPCQDASCDPAGPAGNCDTINPVPNHTSCSDGFFCNGEELCVNGSCVMAQPPCANGLGCEEELEKCLPCVNASNCHDYHSCTLKSCISNTCHYDDSDCLGACCFLDDLCFEGLTSYECGKFSGGFYLGHDVSCENDPDNDGATGCSDLCPFDPRKTSEGLCGCGELETDNDLDGIPDCRDCCDDSVQGASVDSDGCAVVGACRSISGKTCLDGLSEPICGSIGGIYLGNGTTCEAPCIICRNRGTPGSESMSMSKTRMISLQVSTPFACESALRVKLLRLHQVSPSYTGGPSVPFSQFEGQVRWVGPPVQYLESNSGATSFFASQLQCTPHYQDWSTVGLLHVTGSAIVPSSVYEVENVAASCQGIEASCTAVSAPLTVVTTRWGDVETPYNPPSATIQPDLADVSALVNKFRNAPGAPIKARALLIGVDAAGTLDIATEFSFIHIAGCVDAFRGRPYPHTIQACP